MRRALAWSLAALILAAYGKDDRIKQELQRLEGTWVQVSVEESGKSATSHPEQLIIAGEQWIVSGVEFAATFSVDPTKEPKQIDVVMHGSGSTTFRLPGIYKLEGDTLTVSMSRDMSGHGKRPAEFSTKPGDPFSVIVYKRDTTQQVTLDWKTDWQSAFSAAKQEGRLVFVDYFATWCKPCQVMDAT